MIGVDLKLHYFFDTAAVERALQQKQRRALARTGAYARAIIRNSMKSGRGGSAPPGQPPRYHLRTLKDRIFFAYDPAGSVVVGPTLSTNSDGTLTVPELLEQGGTVTVRRRDARTGKYTRRERHRYRPRPFVAPALTAAMARLREELRE